MHPVRFGVILTEADSADSWIASARRAEELGYDILLMPDHLGGQLSPLAGLMAAAAATRRLRVGSYVLANDVRHPMVMAREAATIHFLSGGRFELGMGAGWSPDDYLKLGLPLEAPARRIDRLTEAVPLVKRLLAGETIDHVGAHYPMTGARIGVKTGNLPRPAILIGGGGPRVLRLAAREADIVGIQPQIDHRGRAIAREATAAGTARKIGILREAAGTRFDHLELNVIIGRALLLGGRARQRGSLALATRTIAAGWLGRSYVLAGTRGQLSEGLKRRRDRVGISYYAIHGNAMEELAPLVADLAGT